MVRKFGLVIVFTAVCVGAWLCFRGTGHRQAEAINLETAARDESRSIASERVPSGVEELREQKNTEASATARGINDGESDHSQSPSIEPSAIATLNSGANAQPVPSEIDGISEVPEGSPFPITESIERECASGEDLDWDCPGVKRTLKTFEDEPRDTQWATSMESRLRAAVATAQGVRIRAVACRSTVCVIETDGAHLRSYTWDPLGKDLLDAGYIRAYEPPGNGNGTFRVQLWTFTRRR
jgi:hypothetical protein